jgi:uncharacterized cupin superfamily protein
MPKIDIASVPLRKGSTYPAPFHEIAPNRIKQALGDAAGLTQFGVNLTRLPPGEWSSQRHWHSDEDEFIYVLSGTLTLVTDEGRATLSAGECAAFAKGVPNGHHLINESEEVAVYLEVGTCTDADAVTYPDIDMYAPPGNVGYTHRDGRPYPRGK